MIPLLFDFPKLEIEWYKCILLRTDILIHVFYQDNKEDHDKNWLCFPK